MKESQASKQMKKGRELLLWWPLFLGKKVWKMEHISIYASYSRENSKNLTSVYSIANLEQKKLWWKNLHTLLQCNKSESVDAYIITSLTTLKTEVPIIYNHIWCKQYQKLCRFYGEWLAITSLETIWTFMWVAEHMTQLLLFLERWRSMITTVQNWIQLN